MLRGKMPWDSIDIAQVNKSAHIHASCENDCGEGNWLRIDSSRNFSLNVESKSGLWSADIISLYFPMDKFYISHPNAQTRWHLHLFGSQVGSTSENIVLQCCCGCLNLKCKLQLESSALLDSIISKNKLNFYCHTISILVYYEWKVTLKYVNW